VDDAVIPRSAERSRRTGDSNPPPKQPLGLAADDGDPGDGAVILRSAERSRRTGDSGDSTTPPKQTVGLAADSGDSGDSGDPLSSVSSYIRQFLICHDHHLTILSLWSLYTWCYQAFTTSVYLDVRSPGPQCGKTRCLTILFELCNHPDIIAGADSRTARLRLLLPCRTVEQITDDKLTGPYTFLFDDCHLALTTSERQPLLALLNSGTGRTTYSHLSDVYMVSGPKAFAASAPLPHSLADRCIPIVLHRKKASDKVNYFALGRHECGLNADDDNILPSQLRSSLERWAQANRKALHWSNRDPIPDLPVGMSPAQLACAEPLFRIADRIGGDWPEKARAAIVAVFNIPLSNPGLQILSDLRACFLAKDDPEYLFTRDLLAMLTSMEHRPWGGWHSRSGNRLGALLKPYGISSRKSLRVPKGAQGLRTQRFRGRLATLPAFLPAGKTQP